MSISRFPCVCNSQAGRCCLGALGTSLALLREAFTTLRCVSFHGGWERILKGSSLFSMPIQMSILGTENSSPILEGFSLYSVRCRTSLSVELQICLRVLGAEFLRLNEGKVLKHLTALINSIPPKQRVGAYSGSGRCFSVPRSTVIEAPCAGLSLSALPWSAKHTFLICDHYPLHPVSALLLCCHQQRARSWQHWEAVATPGLFLRSSCKAVCSG